MIDFELTMEREDMLRELVQLEMAVADKLIRVFETVGWETIAYLRSETSKMQPPNKRSGGRARPAHPGGWADVSSNLALAYRFELYAGGELVRWTNEGEGPVQGSVPRNARFPLELKFLNGMEYAVYLEARDGYWVLREITEENGPVQRAIRTVVNRLIPDVTIQVET